MQPYFQGFSRYIQNEMYLSLEDPEDFFIKECQPSNGYVSSKTQIKIIMAGLLYSISIFFFLMLKTKQKKIILFLLMVQVIFIMEIFSGRFRKDQKKQNKFLNQKIVLLKIVKIMRMILKKRMTKK